jgi:hypothetical protein
MTSPLFRALRIATLLLSLPACRAQKPCADKPSATPPYGERLETMLAHAAAEAATLSGKLPSFVCKETVISETLNKGEVKKRVDIVAEFSVQRSSSGKFGEKFTIKEMNGKPFGAAKFNIPLYVSGGFQHAMDYFSSEFHSCYRYALSGNRIDFEAVPDAESRTGCSHEIGIKGFALFDPDDELIHVERRVPPEIARRFNSAPVATLDLVPVLLNGQTYRLTSHVAAEMPMGKGVGHFEGTYTDCRLFTAKVTLRSGGNLINDDSPVPPPK